MRAGYPARAIAGSDEALLTLIANGDAQALADLYDRYNLRARAIAFRVVGDRQVAEEVAQEAFLSVWRRAHTYDPSHGVVRPWLFAIVHHAALDSLRRSKEEARQLSLEEAWMSPARTDVFGDAYANLQRAQVRACILRLPSEQRAAIERVYYSGESFVEISRVTGVPVGTLKSRVRLGMTKLRRMLAAVA